MLTVSADQNTHILVNGRIPDHRKRSFEWTSKWTVNACMCRSDVIQSGDDLMGLNVRIEEV